MDISKANDLIRQTFILALFISAPMLLIGLIVGLVISLIQALTQIQEQTLSFIPKTAAMVAIAIVLMPWMTQELVEFAARLIGGR